MLNEYAEIRVKELENENVLLKEELEKLRVFKDETFYRLQMEDLKMVLKDRFYVNPDSLPETIIKGIFMNLESKFAIEDWETIIEVYIDSFLEDNKEIEEALKQ